MALKWIPTWFPIRRRPDSFFNVGDKTVFNSNGISLIVVCRDSSLPQMAAPRSNPEWIFPYSRALISFQFYRSIPVAIHFRLSHHSIKCCSSHKNNAPVCGLWEIERVKANNQLCLSNSKEHIFHVNFSFKFSASESDSGERISTSAFITSTPYFMCNFSKALVRATRIALRTVCKWHGVHAKIENALENLCKYKCMRAHPFASPLLQECTLLSGDTIA